MAINKGPSKNIAGVHKSDALSIIQAQLAVITKGAATVSFIQTNSSCDFCGGGHNNNNCQVGNNLPSSKMSKPTILTTCRDRTIPTPTRTIQVGGATQSCNGGTTT